MRDGDVNNRKQSSENHINKNHSLRMLPKFVRGKGFAIPAHDMYGSNQGLWDFGPLGVLMKEKISKEWWKSIYSLAKTRPALFPTKSKRDRVLDLKYIFCNRFLI